MDDFLGGTCPGGRRDNLFARSGRLVQSKEDGTKIFHRLVAGVRLQFRLDIDNEGRADCGEQTSLR